MFAARDAVQEFLGFTLFELGFGHLVRGQLEVFMKTWLKDNSPYSLLKYMLKFRQWL